LLVELLTGLSTSVENYFFSRDNREVGRAAADSVNLTLGQRRPVAFQILMTKNSRALVDGDRATDTKSAVPPKKEHQKKFAAMTKGK